MEETVEVTARVVGDRPTPCGLPERTRDPAGGCSRALKTSVDLGRWSRQFAEARSAQELARCGRSR